MKKLISAFAFAILALMSQGAFSQSPSVASGYSIKKIASGGVLANQILDGITADPSGNVYVAAVSSVYSTSMNLYKINTSGTVSLIGNYSIGHYEVAKMVYNSGDGCIYTGNNQDGHIYKINVSTGAATQFTSTGFGYIGRYGLQFNPNGDLIYSPEPIYDFYKVTSSGITLLGNAGNQPDFNHGDDFAIDPDGKYLVPVDCGGKSNYAVNPNTFQTVWTSPTNVFTSLLPGGCGYSIGTVDPNTGDLYSSIAQFGNGNSRILYTPADGSGTTLFVDDASGIMDLCFGGESSGGGCNSLYFIDRTLNAVYEVPMNNCCTPLPGAVTVTGSGTFCGKATISASGGSNGTLYYQGTDGGGTSTSNTATSVEVTQSGTYYWRAKHTDGCWGKPAKVVVIIKPSPETPVISPTSAIEYCDSNSTSTTLSIPALSYSDPKTYKISSTQLVDAPYNCGSGSLYGGNQYVGFKWTDDGNGLVDSVEIKFNIGVDCYAGLTRNTFLNDQSVSTFTSNTDWCTCSQPNSERIITIKFKPVNYNIGGENIFKMDAYTFGFFPANSLGGYYATVKVKYKAPPVLWSTGATTNSITVAPTSTTTYTVTVTGGNGCTSEASKTIKVNAVKPTISISPESPSFCQGSSVKLTATGSEAGTYLWNTGATTASIDADQATTYSVTFTNANGCSATAEIAVTQNSNPTVSISPNPAAFCKGSYVALTASGSEAGSYLWNTGETTASIQANTATTYSVTFTNANGCKATANQEVTQNSNPVANAGADVNLYYGYDRLATGTFNGSASGGSGSYTYSWSTGATTQSISVKPTSTASYTLTVTDANGCKGTDQVTAKVQDVRCGNKMDKVKICHNTGSNKNPTNEICIDSGAVWSHMKNHNCVPGSCAYSWGDVLDLGNKATLTVSPNPVTSGSSASFYIPSDDDVTVKIYNNSGTLLSTVFNGSARSGNIYTYSLDYGVFTYTGTYYVKLVTSTESVTVSVLKN